MAKNAWIISTILMVFLLAAVIILTSPEFNAKSDAPAAVMTGARIEAPFSLTNQDGKTVTDRDVAGKFRLMYFGFTFCPSVCPTELQKIAEVLQGLGPLADQITPIFVTIDPDRDPPAALKTYLVQFDPRFVGLTGQGAELKKLADAYKVYYRKVGEGPDYTMDHSAFTYLLSPGGDLLALYRPDQTARAIEDDLRPRLSVTP